MKQVIRSWFELVDKEQAGEVNSAELVAALVAAEVPCDVARLRRMLRLLDKSGQGRIR